MPTRIRVAVNDAMAEVDQAAHASENAAKWIAVIAQRIYQNGLEIDLDVPKEVRTKLGAVPIAGQTLLRLLDALDGVGLQVNLGQPAKKPE